MAVTLDERHDVAATIPISSCVTSRTESGHKLRSLGSVVSTSVICDIAELLYRSFHSHLSDFIGVRQR